MGKEISVIIPSNHGHAELDQVVSAVCSQAFKPYELVILDSSVQQGGCPPAVLNACEKSGIRLTYVTVAHAYPGHARNLGIERAQSPWLAFCDVLTLPKPDWLARAVAQIESDQCDGVWGATVFEASSLTGRLLRDGLYGMSPRRTLPGTVFNRSIIATVGGLIPWVRAGEDTDWMRRIILMRLRFADPDGATMSYVGLKGVRLAKMLSKWIRYYSASRDLPHLFPQKVVVWALFYPMLILIAMNWNQIVAHWQMDSPWYIPNVTKLAASFPPLAYVMLRGFILPARRGVPLTRLLPFRFALIALVCGMLDLAKAVIFTLSPFIGNPAHVATNELAD